jgi:hypothetical protein
MACFGPQACDQQRERPETRDIPDKKYAIEEVVGERSGRGFGVRRGTVRPAFEA